MITDTQSVLIGCSSSVARASSKSSTSSSCVAVTVVWIGIMTIEFKAWPRFGQRHADRWRLGEAESAVPGLTGVLTALRPISSSRAGLNVSCPSCCRRRFLRVALFLTWGTLHTVGRTRTVVSLKPVSFANCLFSSLSFFKKELGNDPAGGAPIQPPKPSPPAKGKGWDTRSLYAVRAHARHWHARAHLGEDDETR